MNRAFYRMPFDPGPIDLRRVVVIGTSCCGKTTFARTLARRLGAPHVELDALHWGPGWTAASEPEFRKRAAEAAAGESWIIDGNYRAVQDLVWPRATTIVWLDYSFPTIFGRALRRTFRRVVGGERLYGGNRESFARAFLSHDSILWWVITTWAARRRRYREKLAAISDSGLRVLRFGSPRETDRFVISPGVPATDRSA